MAQIRIEGTSDVTRVEQGLNAVFDKLDRIEKKTEKVNSKNREAGDTMKRAGDTGASSFGKLSDITDRFGVTGLTAMGAVAAGVAGIVVQVQKAIQAFKDLEAAQLKAANAAGTAQFQVADFLATASPEEANRVRGTLTQGNPAFTDPQLFRMLDVINAADLSDKLTNEQEAGIVNRTALRFGDTLQDPARMERIFRDIGQIASTGAFTPEEAEARGTRLGFEDIEGAAPAGASLVRDVLGGSQLGAEQNKILADRLLALNLTAMRAGAGAGDVGASLTFGFRQQQQGQIAGLVAQGISPEEARQMVESQRGGFAQFAMQQTAGLFSPDEAERQAAASRFRFQGRQGIILESQLNANRTGTLDALAELQTANAEEMSANLGVNLGTQGRLASAQQAAANRTERIQAEAGTDEQRLALIRQMRAQEVARLPEEEQAFRNSMAGTFEALSFTSRSESMFAETARLRDITKEDLFRETFGSLPADEQMAAFEQFIPEEQTRNRRVQSGRTTRTIEADPEAVQLLREIRDSIAAQQSQSVDINIRGNGSTEAAVN